MNTEWRRRWRETAGRTRRRSGEASLTTVVLGLTVCALLTVTTGLWCMRQLEGFGPSIGGIIVFKPDPIASERWVVHAVRLESGTVGLPQNSDVRHSGSGDCGPAADLLLDRTDVMRLANAAGGLNVGLRLMGP
jgi:hypothetical protein